MPNPIVSIVLPTYNRAHMIDSAIVSILQQSFTNFELIIVNDCSTDHTQQMLAKWQQQDKRIKIITNRKNQKLPESLNIGFRHARGKYLTWTSDDNRYKQGALEFMVRHLEKNPTTGMVVTMQTIVNENGKIHNRLQQWQRLCFHVFFLPYASNIGGCFLYRRSIAQKVGNYDNNLFGAEDYDFFCRLAILSKIDYCPQNFYYYQNHSTSLSQTINLKVRHALKTIRQKYSRQLQQKYPVPLSYQKLQTTIMFFNTPNWQNFIRYICYHPFFIFHPPIRPIVKMLLGRN